MELADGSVVTVGPYTWEVTRPVVDGGSLSREVVGTYTQLPCRLAWAITIHKSQGSEYRHAVVVLPERASRIVTRELLYTGVTRASEKVTIVGSRGVIEAAITKPIRRATGLQARLG